LSVFFVGLVDFDSVLGDGRVYYLAESIEPVKLVLSKN
jgi:hypothetical protein